MLLFIKGYRPSVKNVLVKSITIHRTEKETSDDCYMVTITTTFFVKNMFMKNATSKGFFYSQPIKLPSFSYTPCSVVSYCVSSCFMHPYVCFIFFLCIKNFHIIWGLEVRDLESGKAFLGSSLLV